MKIWCADKEGRPASDHKQPEDEKKGGACQMFEKKNPYNDPLHPEKHSSSGLRKTWSLRFSDKPLKTNQKYIKTL